MMKSLKAMLKQDKEKYTVPKSVHDYIPITAIWEDGIFKVGNKYAKTFRFTDINYLVAGKEDKETMFLCYSELLNSLDSGATTKLTINNRRINKVNFEKEILIPKTGDELDCYREEYNNILLDKASNANGIIQEKYLTVSVVKKDIEEARTYFARIASDLRAHFSALGSKCEELDAAEKLRLLHDFYRAGEEASFRFDLADMMKKGHDFKDYICPDSMERADDYVKLGEKYVRVLFLKDYASYIKDSMVSELTELNRNMMLSIDILPIPMDEAIREVENRLLGVATNITNWQRKQNQNNNFSAVVPYDMEQQRKESEEFLNDLTTRDQRMMCATVTIAHMADSKEQLDADTETILSTARRHLCQLAVLKFQQTDGLNTVLPIGCKKIQATRTLTTESLAVFMPFKVQEVAHEHGIYYGQNAISNNMINLIKPQQMFSLTLPHKVKGQYWLTDIDANGESRDLISIEAVKGEWVLKSNKKVSILDAENKVVSNTILKALSFFNLKINGSNDRVILFAENIDESRQTLNKVVVKEATTLSIGRTNDNNLCYENKFVSGKHAKLSYDGNSWSISDLESTNGTYVNGYRVTSGVLNSGDFIYIMGLKIIVGNSFLAINNPDNLLHITSGSLKSYKPQLISERQDEPDIPEKTFFFRSPRFHREVEHAEIKIDPPPQLQKIDTVPLALMLGPSITMGMTSLSTGLLTLNNVISNGGEMTQALPTLLMSVSMLLGTVLWPILTKKYEKKQRLINDKKRQDKYLAYLDEIRDEIKRKCKEQSDILSENLVSPDACADRIAEQKQNLWERVPGQDDFLRLRLGLGNLPLDADVKYPEKKFTMDDDNLQDAMLSLGSEPKQLIGVPISVSLVENTTVGVCGEYLTSTNMLKSLILQMIALHSYDELKIVLITDESERNEWDFIRPIPHFWNDDKTTRFFASNADEVKELSAYMEKNIVSRTDAANQDYSDFSPYYVIISTSKKLTENCEALGQLLKFKNNRGFSILLSGRELRDLPKETKLVISLCGDKSKMFTRDDTSGKSISFKADIINETAIDNLAQDIANIELDLGSKHFALPSMITFLEMFNVGKIEHLNSLTRWKENNPTISLQTPIGVDSYGGLFNLDLHEKFHGPHGLVAGMTGSGKSEFIITYILSLAVNYHPDEVAFILIDYKGGGLTGAFEDDERGIKLPHLAGTITNLDGAAVKRSLISIQSELRRRQAIFNEARKISNEGTMDIYKYQQLYRDKIVSEPVPHLFIISDEFAELKSQQPEFMEQLISAARIGRSLGVHLILATQKPSGVVDDQIWSNSKFRVCLKVQEKADSQDMIKCPDAAELSQTGRFYLQVGFNELFALGQSAWCGAEYIPTETVEKSVDSSIQVVDNLGRVIMNVKPNKKKRTEGSKIKQIVAIVKYLSDLAGEEKITVRPLWLEPIPEFIYVDELESKYGIDEKGFALNPVIGEYDDPCNQKQGVLTIPFTKDGNCLVYGSTGNGKATFLTSLCYALIKNHTVEELNLYIMDFGSETLKAFENAPQVGGVIVSSDEEKTINFIKMLHGEIERRRNLFSEYGGDYQEYIRNSGKTEPNIVVVMNNYSGFAEQYEDLQDEFSLLTRDGVKYGIYFAVTASSVNAVRYKTQQNFKNMLTMQLNDATDYSIVVGKTDGLIPSKYKGRGLVALERVYEFQTAYCRNVADMQDYLREFCKEFKQNSDAVAKPIPVLPDVVNLDYVSKYSDGIRNIPIGVGKKSLNVLGINLQNKVVYPFVSQEIYEMIPFVEEFVRVLSSGKPAIIIDAEQALSSELKECAAFVTGSYESFVLDLFNEMVLRNNTYKDAGLNPASLDRFEERVYVIVGMKRLLEQLSADSKDKLSTLLEKGEAIFKLHFVIIESVSGYGSFSYDAWYKRHLNGTDGVWIGDGIADQYFLKISKVTSDLYEEVGNDYGYLVSRNRPTLMKALSHGLNEEVM